MSENHHDTLSASAQVTADPFLIDHNYRHEARKAYYAHLGGCHEAMQQAGATPPELPMLDDKTISGLAAAEALLNQRWIFSFDIATMKPHLLPISLGAYVLTKEQIQKNIEEILPRYRLIEKPVYEQLTAKQNNRFLQVDFSHRISQGAGPMYELLETLRVTREELSGIFGVVIHLVQTTEENKLCASIATCIAQELKNFASLLELDYQENEKEVVEKLNASYRELDEMNGVLIESLGNSEKDRFGYGLISTADKKLLDIRALLDAYTQQSQTAAKADEAGAQ